MRRLAILFCVVILGPLAVPSGALGQTDLPADLAALLSSKRQAEAIEILKARSASDPHNATLLVQLGEVYGSTGDHDNSDASALKALALDPKSGAAHELLCDSAYIRKDLDTAVAECRTALSLTISPWYAHDAHLMLGYALIQKSRYVEAADALAQAVANAPSAVPEGTIAIDNFELGTTLFMLGRYSEALGPLLTARRLSLPDPTLNFSSGVLGIVYRKLGQAREAKDYTDEWERSKPSPADRAALKNEEAYADSQSGAVPPASQPKGANRTSETGQTSDHAGVVASAAAQVDLRVGDAAPSFVLSDFNGTSYDSVHLRGKAVVMVWFSTSVMFRGSMFTQIVQCQKLRDAASYLQVLNAQVFMVSLNTAAENKAFVNGNCAGLPFPVLSDLDGRVAAAFGVARTATGIDPRTVMGGNLIVPRGSFALGSTTYIGEDGRIMFQEDLNETSGHLGTFGRDVAVKLRDLGIRTPEEAAAAKAAKEPKTVTLGQTMDQVEAILGKPDAVARLGSKTVYSYRNLKVIFTDGKVTDVQ